MSGRILGVGLQKTGTTTLGAALRALGLRHQSYAVRAARMYTHGSIEELLVWADRFESFDDVPWALMYREFDQRYPGSQFILTRRRSPAAWFGSLVRHNHRLGWKSASLEMNRAIYGRPDPQHDRQAAIATYERHLAEVRDYFRERPQDLLEVCWDSGDGWAELAGFLGRATPQRPFPHANKSPGWWQKARKRWQAQQLRQRRQRALTGDPEAHE